MLRLKKEVKIGCLTLGMMLMLSLPVNAQSGGTIILDTTGSWRSFFSFSTTVVQDGAKLTKVGPETNSPLPPSDWTSVEFDDANWMRSSVPFASWSHYIKSMQMQMGFSEAHGDSIAMSVICLRGKFNGDPARAGKLNLSLVYRGGVVVYINGKEVARGNMPKEVKLESDTPAEVYPKEVYINDKGKILDKSASLETLQARLRTLENITIPREALRKGLNVLAIEVHRSPFPKEVYDKLKGVKTPEGELNSMFDGCGLVTARLTGNGMTPNVARPSKTQIWNSQPLAADYDTDWGDPNEPLKPIDLVGAKNGFFSGKVVVGATSSIKKIKGVVTDLSGKTGGKIPASAIQVRYGVAELAEGEEGFNPVRIDSLEEIPPKEIPVRVIKSNPYVRTIPGSPDQVFGAVCAVWVTVNVPADAKSDDYEGELNISVDGGNFKVPLKLRVYNYKLPDPKDFVTFAELIQSPETLALVYKVPLWSEKHWKLIEKSLAYLGALGTKTCYIPLICKTNQGNAETMVRWIKDKEKYKYDFTIMEKYLDLVEKYQGKPTVVCFYVWDLFLLEGEAGDSKYLSKEVLADLAASAGKGPEVTLLNNGKAQDLVLPKYKDPKAKALWKPLADELKAIMKKRKLEKAMMMGVESDADPEPETVKFWQELLEVPWVHQAHNRGSKTPLGFTATVWDRNTILDSMVKTGKTARGWKSKELSTFFCRDTRNGDASATFRMMGEVCAFGGQRGFARQGADFWSIKSGAVVNTFSGGQSGAGLTASDGRFFKSSWRNLNIRTALLASGPDGAIATTRFEMMREGVQECEARIAIEKAIDDNKLKADQSKRCEKMFFDRNDAIFWGFYDSRYDFLGKRGFGFSTYRWAGTPPRYGAYYYTNSGWQERSADLYDAAAEVTSKEKNSVFSVSYRDLKKSGVKESFDKEVKIGAFTVKIESNPFVPDVSQLNIKFQTEKLTLVTAGIYNDKKELVKKLASSEAHSKWDWNLVWDGKDDNGVLLKEGKYTAKINIGGKEGTVTIGIEKKSE